MASKLLKVVRKKGIISNTLNGKGSGEALTTTREAANDAWLGRSTRWGDGRKLRQEWVKKVGQEWDDDVMDGGMADEEWTKDAMDRSRPMKSEVVEGGRTGKQ